MQKKIIGILGGMGPESTILFYQEIIKQCQKQYGAKYDSDYPEIFIYNLPIPDVVEELNNTKNVLAVLIKGIKKLQSIGVDFIVMPCNTTHYFYEDLRKEISIPFLSIIENVARKAISKKYKKVGLLATETTVKNKIYNENFNKYGIELVLPSEQSRLTKIIKNILAGEKSEKDKVELKIIINELINKGAEAIILGCTDIPILLRKEDLNIEVIDSIEVLAKATVKYAIDY